jgi:predicted transcriptional regulator
MARPPAKELTERELEIMHVCWEHGKLTTAEIRDYLAADGRELAYTTVATLVRILADKGFIKQTNRTRPFVYRPVRSFEEVSRRIVRDLVDRVFQGSHTQLLVQLMESDRLSDKERQLLEQILRESKS